MKLLQKYTLFTLMFLTSSIWGNVADFEFKATFQRNPKIWGTYKLEREKIRIKRGKLKWNKRPSKRIGDVIISKGHLVFVRENKEAGETRIVVDKVPYKRSRNEFTAEKFDQEIMVRLFEKDIKASIPHRDLLEGKIDYNKITCTKERGKLNCVLKGVLNPR